MILKSSRTRAAVLTVVVGALVASCALKPLPAPPGRDPGGSSGIGTDAVDGASVPSCTALAVRSCALPYPSDEFTVADAGSATGRHLEVPGEGLVAPGALRQLGPGASLADAFGDPGTGSKDGFSALSPVIFEVDQSLRAEAVPADGGDVVKVFDTATGAVVPVRVEVPLDAALRGAPATIVMAWPRSRWEYGHTYVARLARVPGAVVEPSPAQAMGWATPWVQGLRQSLAAVDDRAWSELLSATRFTVGSRQDAIGGLQHMAEVAAAADHPVRNLVSHPPVFVEGTSALISGEVAISDFRDDDGVVWAQRQPQVEWVPFILTVPEQPASPSGAPVAVYGHGLLINKESMLVVAAMNARHGVATLGIDVPNHGERSREGGFLLDLANPRKLGRLVDMPLQGIVDHVSLVSALTHHLAGIDLAPWQPLTPPGDGAPDLDPSVMLYEGTSMGGVLGAAEVALIPEIDAAYLQVPGAGVADIIMHSLLWAVFSNVVPAGATAGDAAALMGAATMLLDGTDSTHLLDGLRESGRPVFAQLGVGDAIVPTVTSERFVHMLGLPRVGEQLNPIDAPWAGERIPADGRGFAEVWSVESSPVTQGFMAHVSFTEPRAERYLAEWLDQRLAAELGSQP